MSYVRVENGEVVSHSQVLPNSWDNISNFNVLSEEEIIQHGWYPHRFVGANKPDGYVSDGSNFSIEANEVIEYEQVREKTPEEIQSELESVWESIRSQRNILLAESDWTQLPDSPLSNESRIDWQQYRQDLRDITLNPSPYGIVWPQKPSM